MTSSPCFLYGRLLDPSLLEEAAPGAVFDRIAHLPAHRLSFSESGDAAVVTHEGHTVWGAVFMVPDDQLEAIGTAADDSPIARRTTHAVDRDGERIEVVVFFGDDGGRPDEETVAHMITGGRHWELPAGWIVGLQDLVDPFEF